MNSEQTNQLNKTQVEGPGAILGWAAFLACSWTWCIGMFLPVLLVRDLGIAGWLVFAIPNVLGAAAMGWILKTAQSSHQMVARHRGACDAFSLVTIAFHVFFVTWISGRLLPSRWWILLAAGFVVLVWIVMETPKRTRGFSIYVYGVSLFALLQTLIHLRQGAPRIEPASGMGALIDSLSLLPVCALGFLLCPYLDLTFHRVRQNTTPWGARGAFSLGFGVLFFGMILFSLLYAGPVGRILQGQPVLPEALATILGIHLLMQSGFTVGVHSREVVGFLSQRGMGRWVWPWIIVFIPGLLGALTIQPRIWFGLDAGEFVYRCFMGFYGLVFPAYVWICMIGRGRPTACLIAIAAALPFFWMGFIARQMGWLAPGVGIVLLIGLLPLLQSRPIRR